MGGPDWRHSRHGRRLRALVWAENSAAAAADRIQVGADHHHFAWQLRALDGEDHRWLGGAGAAGGQFAGWRYASGDEFNTLVSNYSGIGIPAGYHGQTNMEPDRIDGLVTLLGSTLDTQWLASFGYTWDSYSGFAEGQGIDFTYGLLADISPRSPGAHHLAIIYDNDLWSNDYSWGKDFSAAPPDHSHLQFGSFLVRDHIAAPVPEPETYAMMLAGLGLLGVVARRRKQKLSA